MLSPVMSQKETRDTMQKGKRRTSQLTLFGCIAKGDTYFDHPAKGNYEKVMEAYYFFNKEKKSKQQCGIDGCTYWKSIEGDQDQIRTLLNKHENKLKEMEKKKFNPFFQPPQKTTKLSQEIIITAPPVEVPSLSAQQNKDARRNTPELEVVKRFLEELENGLSQKFLTELVVTNKLLVINLYKLASVYNKEQVDIVNDSRTRKRKTKLSSSLHEMECMMKDLQTCIAEASDVSVEPSIGFSLLHRNLEYKENYLKQIVSKASKIATFIEKEVKFDLNRRVQQIKDKSRTISPYEKVKIFSYNSDSLDWGVALSSFFANFDDLNTNPSLNRQELWDVAFLLESSSIVPMASVLEFLSYPHEKSVIEVLLKLLPVLYIRTGSNKGNGFLINLYETKTNCDDIDKLIDPDIDAISAPQIEQLRSEETRNVKKGTSNKGGQHSIVSLFPSIPSVATEFIKMNGFKAQEKRRDDSFESCGVTIKQLQKHLLDTVDGLGEHGISNTTVRYLFRPVHKGHKSAQRYKGYIAAKVPKKDNSGRAESEIAHFIHSKVNMRLEHASCFSEDYTVVSADAMNKIHVGTLAVSRYHQIRKRFLDNDHVQYKDHDFPLGYKLIPCGYLTLAGGVTDVSPIKYDEEYDCDEYGVLVVESDVKIVLNEVTSAVAAEIDAESFDADAANCFENETEVKLVLQDLIDSTLNNGCTLKKDKLGRSHINFRRTGPLLVCIRNGMFHHLTVQAHVNDLRPLVEQAVDGGKQFFLLVGDNGPDMDPSSYLNMIYWGRLWRDTNLTRLTCATYPSGQSAYNPIEHCWSPLSNALTGVTLSAVLPGDYKPPHKQNKLTAEERAEKEMRMLDDAASTLTKYWQNITYDGNAVEPHVIPSQSDGACYDDHSDIEHFLSAPLRDLHDNTNEKMVKIRKEFKFLVQHTDRRQNEISFMKCQLFKDPSEVCNACAATPPSNTPAFRYESKCGGYLTEPQPSNTHQGHYKTYLELKKDDTRYVSRTSQPLGRCSHCPNWHFSTKTEMGRHNRFLHRYKKCHSDSTTREFICNYKNSNGKQCGLKFKTYHKLYAHKKLVGHKRNRAEEAKKKAQAEASVSGRVASQKISLKSAVKKTTTRGKPESSTLLKKTKVVANDVVVRRHNQEKQTAPRVSKRKASQNARCILRMHMSSSDSD